MGDVRAGEPFIAVRCAIGEHDRCVQRGCECPHHSTPRPLFADDHTDNTHQAHERTTE